MEQLKYEEWFFQSDYDFETASQMLQTGRNIYCIFMCHLCLEKALKGLYTKRLNAVPPKIHDLMYFVDKIGLTMNEANRSFAMGINGLGLATRYPEDLRRMIKFYTQEQTNEIYEQTKAIQLWLKAQ
jgi:HEPN domain-containing protein